MFNWFKNNLKNLIPNDINDAFLTSKFSEVKLGSSIDLPQGIVCFVSFKDKIYLTATNNLEINSSNLQHLIEKQVKKQEKSVKKVKIDLFFVNLNEQQKSFEYTDKLNISNVVLKSSLYVNYTAKVKNEKKFLGFVLSYLALPEGIDTDNLINGYFEEMLKNFFLRKRLEDSELSPEVLSTVEEKAKSFFSKIGMELTHLDLKITIKDKRFVEQPKKKFSFGWNNKKVEDNAFSPDQSQQTNSFDFRRESDNLKNPTVETVDEETEKVYNEKSENTVSHSTQEETKQADKFCPVCGIKLIAGSKFCHRCGNRNF